MKKRGRLINSINRKRKKLVKSLKKERSIKKEAGPTWKIKILSLLFWVITIAILIYLGVVIDISVVQEYISKTGLFAPLVFIILVVVTIVLLPIIRIPITIISGPLFGFTFGFIYSYIGELIGISICFFITRKYGWKYINFIIPKRHKFMYRVISYLNNWRGLIYARLIFFSFQDMISFASGLSKIRYSSYIISSAIFFIIPMLLMVAIGMALVDRIFLYMVVGIGFFIAVILLGIRIHKRIKRHKK